jgi:hypothetical protein
MKDLCDWLELLRMFWAAREDYGHEHLRLCTLELLLQQHGNDAGEVANARLLRSSIRDEDASHFEGMTFVQAAAWLELVWYERDQSEAGARKYS